MNKKRIRPLLIFVLAVFGMAQALGACNMPRKTKPTEPPVGPIFTAAAQTVDARMTSVSQPPPTADFPTPLPGVTAVTPSGITPQVTGTPPSADYACDRAEFVKDVSVPDNTRVSPGETFVKTWRLRNNGTCTWTSAYALVFQGNNELNAPASVQLTTGTVPPGGGIDISVTLKAPDVAGRYRQDFKLANASGQRFGVDDGSKTFWAQVQVAAQSGIVYDFIANADEATWKSGTGDTFDTDLVFGGANDDPNGVAKVVEGATLENGSTSGKVLLIVPKHVDDGAVIGLFPAYTVQTGDAFRANLGFIIAPDGACHAGRVKFELLYQEGATVQPLAEWRKACDGNLIPVAVELSRLKGKPVQFILLVRADGPYHDDWAVWNSPRIQR